MRKIFLLAGAAMLAAMPSFADAQGNGRGRGGGENRGAESRQEARGQQRAERRAERAERRAERRQGGEARRAQRPERRAERAERREARNERRAERAQRQVRRPREDVREARRERREDRREMRQARRDDRPARALREDRRELRQLRRAERPDRDVRRAARDVRGDYWQRFAEPRRVRDARDRSYRDRYAYWREQRPMPVAAYRDGCPPGLAKQNAFCMPPGQLRRAQLIGQRLPIADWAYNVPERYRYRFDDNSDYYYRYGDDGYVYEFDRGSGLVSSVVPLYATNLLVGEPLPLGYEVYNVPLDYRDYYQDNDDYLYRYDDGAIYRVDNDTGLIDGIVALLTGGTGGLGSLGVGQMLPGGYDVYNVPLDYRDRYYDTDDYMYRYADGNIYQVDPQTRLIQAVISLLA